MILKKTALFCFLSLLNWEMSSQATFIGAQAYKKEFPDGPHYVLCLGDCHEETPHEKQQLNDLLEIILHHKKDAFVIYEGCGPNVSKQELAQAPEYASLLTKVHFLCQQKNLKGFNAEHRPTGDLYVNVLPANFKEMLVKLPAASCGAS